MNHAVLFRRASVAFAVLPLLPILGYALNREPVFVFTIGAISFFLGVAVMCLLIAAITDPPGTALPATARFRFTLRDLFCLATVTAGIVVFIGSGFKCSEAEARSKPNPLPAAAARRFFWEMESGLTLATVGGLIWIRRLRIQHSQLKEAI
jgi:hypothetical protein